MLSAMRSMVSSSWLLVLMGIFEGKSALMKAYPGRNRTNIMPSAWRR